MDPGCDWSTTSHPGEYIMKPKRPTPMLVRLAFLIFLAGCTPIQYSRSSGPIRPGHGSLPQQAERQASAAGRRVLETGRRMVSQKLIIRGGCWDYANAVYNRAGYPTHKRVRVFSGTKGRPPFADTRLIQPGDWLYYSNHSYRGIEHSAIFVKWIDRSKRTGLMLSYGGEGRREPARYRAYDLRSVYRIERARD